MRKTVFFLYLLIIPGLALSQSVTVLDAETGKPVSDVAIYNESKTLFCYTGPNGKANVSAFTQEKEIFFQHFSYERESFTPSDLEILGWTVKLNTRTFEVDEYIVSANRWEQKSDEVPNYISTVRTPSVILQNPQTTADLISLSGEVYVQKSQLGGGSPMIRGFATNRVLIVVDGVRMNNAIYREGNIQNIISLDPNAIDHTEIIFGPGAVIYGSDAIGGVMDFHTRKALYSTGTTPYIKAEAMARYSTASAEKTGHFSFNAGGKKAAFMTSVSYSDFGDLRMGNRKQDDYLRQYYQTRTPGGDTVVINSDPRIQVATGYSQLNTMNKLRIRPWPNVDVSISNHFSQISDVPRYDRLIQEKNGTLRYGDWHYGPQVWMMNDLNITISKPSAIYDEMKLIVARQDYKESRYDRKIFDDILNGQTEKVAVWSLNLDLDKSLNNERSLLYYGLEYVRNNIRSTADTRDITTGVITPAGSRYPNGKNIYNSFSLYSGYKDNITAKVTLNGGLRYNYVSLDSEIADNSFYNFPFTVIRASNHALTGSAGVVYRPFTRTELAANLSTGFRAPNLDDLGKVFESAPGVVVVPNAGLRPEYVYNADLGLARDFGTILHGEVTAFFSWLDNAMVRREFLFNGKDSILYQGEMSGVSAMVNAGYAVVYGIQAKAEIKPLPWLRLKSAITISDGHDDLKEPLRHIPPVFGSAHLIFEKRALRADLYTVFNSAKKYEDMASSERDKAYMYASDNNGNPWSPPWSTLNFKTSYRIINRFEITAGVENIFNLRYRPYSSGIVSPGRNFIISFRASV